MKEPEEFFHCFNFMFVHEFNQFLISFVTMKKELYAKKERSMDIYILDDVDVDVDDCRYRYSVEIASSIISF